MKTVRLWDNSPSATDSIPDQSCPKERVQGMFLVILPLRSNNNNNRPYICRVDYLPRVLEAGNEPNTNYYGLFASPGRLCLERDNHAFPAVEQDVFPVKRWESGIRGLFLRGELLVIGEDRLLMSCHR